MLQCFKGKPHLPLTLGGGGFMNVSIDFDLDLDQIACIITIGVFLFRAIQYIVKMLLQLYQVIINRIASDISSAIRSNVADENETSTFETAGHDTHTKGG